MFPPHVSIFGLFPVLVKCHYEFILVQLCLSNYLWLTCVFIVLSVQFDFVWSTRYSRCFLSALSFPVCIKDYYLSLRPRLRVLVPPCCVHRDRRPDLTVSGAPSPRFVLFVFSSFYLFRSCVLSAADCGYPKPAGWLSGSRGAAPPSRRPAADSMPASDSMPAGSPLTQARRIATDSCPPAAANPSRVDQVHTSRPGEPFLSRVVPTGTF